MFIERLLFTNLKTFIMVCSIYFKYSRVFALTDYSLPLILLPAGWFFSGFNWSQAASCGPGI